MNYIIKDNKIQKNDISKVIISLISYYLIDYLYYIAFDYMQKNI